MSGHAGDPSLGRSSGVRGWRVLAIYMVPVLVMVIAWTVIRYVNQPYRSPTYRRTLPQCVGHAAWVVPIEGAGPAIPGLLWITHRLPFEMFSWVAPSVGGTIYILFAVTLSKMRRGWTLEEHLLLGFGWLMTGAVLFTALTSK